MTSGAGYAAHAFAGTEIQKRSYPNSYGGQFQNKGYELIEELKLLDHAGAIAEQAVALHSAEQCPEGKFDVILDSDQLSLQIHESIGHPIELDRVLGMEANFAGTSFLTLDKLRTLKYGSDIVNVVADATESHGPGLGTFAYDDEGVAAQCTPIITNGLFTGYLTSRDTAAAIGATSQRRMPARGRLEPASDRAHDQCQYPAGRSAADSGTAHRVDRPRHSDGDQSLVVDRRQAIQLSVRLRNGLGDCRRQARSHAEEPFLLRHHHRVLEFDGCHLFARRVDAVGHTQLRQGTAATGDGNRTRRCSGAVPQRQGRHGIQGERIDDAHPRSSRHNLRQAPQILLRR